MEFPSATNQDGEIALLQVVGDLDILDKFIQQWAEKP